MEARACCSSFRFPSFFPWFWRLALGAGWSWGRVVLPDSVTVGDEDKGDEDVTLMVERALSPLLLLVFLFVFPCLSFCLCFSPFLRLSLFIFLCCSPPVFFCCGSWSPVLCSGFSSQRLRPFFFLTLLLRSPGSVFLFFLCLGSLLSPLFMLWSAFVSGFISLLCLRPPISSCLCWFLLLPFIRPEIFKNCLCHETWSRFGSDALIFLLNRLPWRNGRDDEQYYCKRHRLTIFNLTPELWKFRNWTPK